MGFLKKFREVSVLCRFCLYSVCGTGECLRGEYTPRTMLLAARLARADVSLLPASRVDSRPGLL